MTDGGWRRSSQQDLLQVQASLDRETSSSFSGSRHHIFMRSGTSLSQCVPTNMAILLFQQPMHDCVTFYAETNSFLSVSQLHLEDLWVRGLTQGSSGAIVLSDVGFKPVTLRSQIQHPEPLTYTTSISLTIFCTDGHILAITVRRPCLTGCQHGDSSDSGMALGLFTGPRG